MRLLTERYSIVKHTPESKIPELPIEIWLRILLFVHDPKALSQTQKSLYTLCLNPLSSSKWLIAQYGKDAYYGALWFWTKSDIWRRWILKVRPHLPFAQLPVRSSAYFIKKAIKSYYKGWFYLSKSSRCKRCNVSSLMETQYLERQDENYSIDDLKLSLKKKLNESYCQFEHFQIRVCMILYEEGADFHHVMKLLLRYAASVGHSKLLNYLLSICSKTLFDPTFTTEYEIKDDFKGLILELLSQSIQSRKILNVYQCLQTDIVKNQSPEQWRRHMNKIIATFSISLARLFIEKNSHLQLNEIEYAMKLGNVPFLLKKSRESLRKMSYEMLNTISTEAIMEEQELFGLACSEAGREDLILLLHQRGVTFNQFNGLSLYNATLFGNHRVVKVLLQKCLVNPNIFTTARLAVISMLVLDHAALCYALLSSMISFFIECYCRIQNHQGSNIGVFLLTKEGSLNSGLCIPDDHNTTPWASLFIVIFFICTYAFLNSFVSIIPLLRCIFMIIKQIHKNKRLSRISAGDLES